MNILGISAFYHDSAAALVRDGQIIAAAQEERFTRKKHDAAFPRQAIDYCLREAHFNLGVTLMAQGKREEAAEHFAAALKANPDDQVSREALKALGRNVP